MASYLDLQRGRTAFGGDSIKSVLEVVFVPAFRSRHHRRKFPKVLRGCDSVTFYVLVKSKLSRGVSSRIARNVVEFFVVAPGFSPSFSCHCRTRSGPDDFHQRRLFVFLRRELPAACSPRGRITHFPRFRYYAHPGLPHKFTARR